MTRTLAVLSAHAATLAAALVLAAAAGAAPLPLSGTLDLGTASRDQAVRWSASEVNGLAGAAVAGIGDFDGDGRPDLAVGEPKGDGPAGPDSGTVRIVLDAARGGALDDAAAVVAIRGAHAGDRAGFAVRGAGDVNGDGFADVVIGAPNLGAAAPPAPAQPAGEAYVVFGRAGRGPIDLAGDFGGLRIAGGAPGDELGRAVGTVPDLNGDGLAEVVVGAPGRDVAGRPDAGSAYVVFGGRESGTVDVGGLAESGRGWRLDGPVGSVVGGAGAGRAVGSIADLNGDGRPEVLVTAPRGGTGLAPGVRPKGLAYVVWGRAEGGVVDLESLGGAGFTMTGRATDPGEGAERSRNGDFLGESIEPVGDVNGDGRPDLVVGAHLADARDRLNAGISYVVFGKGDAGPVDLERLGRGGFRVTGIDEQDQTGFDTAAAGDFNADGLADIVVSSLFAEPVSHRNAGAVYVVWGRRGRPADVDLAEFGGRALRIAGAREQDTAGYSVDSVGDVDGDRAPDLVLGLPATSSTDAATGTSRRPGGAAVVFGAAGRREGRPAETLLAGDPGYAKERRAGCDTAVNVQVMMEDNAYTDGEADRERIRAAGIQAYIASPRNQGTVLGITGFDEDGDVEPIVEPTVLARSRAGRLSAAVARAVDGEDDFPGYPQMVRTFANDNPGATARILLVDGVLFGEMEEERGLTHGNPPSYVIAVGDTPDRGRDDVREMRRLARETGGRYFEARSSRAIERALQSIESRLRCDVAADREGATVAPGGEATVAEVRLEDPTESADVRLTWADRQAGFEFARVELVRGGRVVRTLTGEAIARAYGATRTSDAPFVARRNRRSRDLHLRGLSRGGTLRVVARVGERRRGGRVVARVTQSRRRG